MRTRPLILTARVLAGCSLEATTPAAPAPAAAKVPEFPPALTREDVAGIKARCASGPAGGVSAAEVVRKGKSPSGAIEEFDLQRIHPSAETKRSCGAGGCENPAFRVSAYGAATPRFQREVKNHVFTVGPLPDLGCPDR